MKGYVARKGDRYYAVIYEGLDSLTGAIADGGIPPAPTKQQPRHWQPISPIDIAAAAAMSAAASPSPCT